MEGKTFTRDQVSTAVNAGADLVRDELELGDRDCDLLNVAVCAMLTVLDDPSADLDKVIAQNWELGEGTENPRDWWGGWS